MRASDDSRVIGPLLRLSIPVLVAQLAQISMAIADTIFVGRFGTTDLAGVAIGSSVLVTVQLCLSGILQAISPAVAHLVGARNTQAIAATARQGIWLALACGALGFAILHFPDPIVALSAPDAAVARVAEDYLRAASWGIPAQMLYRAFHAFSAALGRTRPVMLLSAAGALLHLPLSWLLIHGSLGQAPLGGLGAGVSTAVVGWAWCLGAAVFVWRDPAIAPYRVFAAWEPPSRRNLAELLRLGLPIGLSNLVEVSAFTLIALFVAPLGAQYVAGHRIALNITASCYMLPLALGYGLTVMVGQAVGAGNSARAEAVALRGTWLAGGVAAIVSLLILAAANPLVAAYSTDPQVRAVALGLTGYCAALHVVDALQTAVAFALRGYKVTFVPMLVHILAFWGIGLAGGWWLTFGRATSLGVAGFWLAATLGTTLASAVLGLVIRRVLIERRLGL